MTTREINFWNGIALGLVLGVALASWILRGAL